MKAMGKAPDEQLGRECLRFRAGVESSQVGKTREALKFLLATLPSKNVKKFISSSATAEYQGRQPNTTVAFIQPARTFHVLLRMQENRACRVANLLLFLFS
jgi:hypothetical protein